VDKYVIKRTPTGIPGLDELIEGGFIENDSILIAGSTGTGKTTFALQFLYYGAKELDEPGIYVTFEEMPQTVRQDMYRYGWDFEKLEKNNKLAFLDACSTRTGVKTDEKYVLSGIGFEEMITEIAKIVGEIDARRLVLDSLTTWTMQYKYEWEIRKEILRLVSFLKELGVTSLLLTEMPEGSNQISKYGIEEFVARGVIVLYYRRSGIEMRRYLLVRKMRGTKHASKFYAMDITDTGIQVYPYDTIYQDGEI